MYGIASRITTGAPTMYDAVQRIERYLNRNFTYSEKPRAAQYPLNAFLFRDKFGYCQQFSGAMALMLRMAGIPARVAAGFAPGSLNRDSGEYRVRDLDAHSWVEVYFNASAVTFARRPQPRASEPSADINPITPPAASVNGSRNGLAAPDPKAGAGGGAPRLRRRLSGGCWVPLLVLGRRGTLAWAGPPRAPDGGRELPRRSWPTGAARSRGSTGTCRPTTTLLASRGASGRAAGPAAARYAAALRAYRYDPPRTGAPSLAAPRAAARPDARTGLRGRVVDWRRSRLAARGRLRPDLCSSKEGGLHRGYEHTKQRLGVSNLVAALGGLVVLVIGAILIETDVIDTGDTTKVVRQAPISQPAADTDIPARARRSTPSTGDGPGVVFIQSEGVSGGEDCSASSSRAPPRAPASWSRRRDDHHQRAVVTRIEVTVSFKEAGRRSQPK